MKKILLAILSFSALALSSCSTYHEAAKADNNTQSISKRTDDYAKIIAIPAVLDELLNDKMTPSIGPKDAKKAVVVFYDYGCDKCTQTYEKMSKLIKEEPDVRFIFKAYPSLKADDDAANYASLVANEAYLQGGPELFSEYNKIIYTEREANGKLTNEDIDNAIKQLNIKANKPELKKQAAEEELKTKKVAKLIGFQGPHSYIVLPTDLAKMGSQKLEDNVSQICVIAFNEPSDAEDYHKSVDWSIDKIKTELKGIK
ncbi:thioredoxin domain-containing protein [Francisella uliginis]|uniref:Thioredoxin domain-containing protein n=1 Tax=Francisella uliginis TaxID=573570 RepID=A0A1L4BRE6_9GAMM|nr:thioredoxin domain-containing protein [Francisella uliginis]API86410.1 hypothetical protein F7310_03150 [Francisella uliginis]